MTIYQIRKIFFLPPLNSNVKIIRYLSIVSRKRASNILKFFLVFLVFISIKCLFTRTVAFNIPFSITR